jgi:hypothetical protein
MTDARRVGLAEVAPAFAALAHRIGCATAATTSSVGEPRSRVLRPVWTWDGKLLTGWVATLPTPVLTTHLASCPRMSLTYWHPSTQDTCTADCRAVLRRPSERGDGPLLVELWPYRLRVTGSGAAATLAWTAGTGPT